MKILIYGHLHHKNIIGICKILQFLQWDYKFSTNLEDIKNYDIIYSPSDPIQNLECSEKLFIYGPHFSVFPTHKLNKITDNQKAIYIQPSIWAKKSWGKIKIPIHVFPFPVDIEYFSPRNILHKDKVFVYIKRRDPKQVEYVCNFLKQKNINFSIFDYLKKYNEKDYLNILQQSKYGIIIDAHESQGFAIQEALSCNVPLLVWNVTKMNQEWGSRYNEIECTTIPYWDERCGHFFYQQDEFIAAFEHFQQNIENYRPREYITEYLSTLPLAKQFEKLIKNIL